MGGSAGAGVVARRGAGPADRASGQTYATLTRGEARALLAVRPDPVAAIRRPGRDPHRILLFGTGILRGTGLSDHESGLPGHIADELARRRDRGVHLDVVVDPDPTGSSALAGLSGLRLRRYDAVVVFIEQMDVAQVGDTQWRGALVGLMRMLLDDTSSSAGLYFYDSTRALLSSGSLVKPRTIRAAQRFAEVAQDVCALSRRARFAELQPPVLAVDPVSGFAEGSYRDWSAAIVDRMESGLRAADVSLADDAPRRFRESPVAERLRQRAVDTMRLRQGDRDLDLDREIRQAKLVYQASLAALSIVDGETLWSLAITGSRNMLVQRAGTPCDLGVRADRVLVIEDLWVDARTRHHPALRGPQPLRSYAGYPVHTWDGYRIGMVCIFNDAPNAFGNLDLGLLRDAAGRVESLLWSKTLRSPA